MTNKIYNWGILAPGGIAHKFASDLTAHVPNARVHAVGSRSLERAQAFAHQYGATHAFGSYEELVLCADIDIIYIASPHSEHYEHTKLCLNAGIPVLCEKAFAVNSAQLAEMVALARSKKIFLQEAIWTRFHPSVAQVQQWIANGAIGDIVHVEADFGYQAPYDPKARWFNPELTGGSLLDIGIYPLFISKLLLGVPLAYSAVGVFTAEGVDLTTSMALKFSSGATASLFSTFATNTGTLCYIYGTKGHIFMQGRFHETKQITLFENDKEAVVVDCERLGHGYSYEAIDAQRCLAEGRTENDKLDLDFSLELMALMDGIRKQIGLVYPEDK